VRGSRLRREPSFPRLWPPHMVSCLHQQRKFWWV